MKKSLVAMTAMAVVGAANAQSSVTMFGILDMAASHYTNVTRTAQGNDITASQTALTPSGLSQSRLGFRGTENLGAGLAASFWLEGSITGDTGGGGTGGLLFNRRSTVSLSSRFGEVRLGRDYTPTFWNDNVFDPFSNNGVGASLLSAANGYSSSGAATNGFTANPNYVRTSNSVGYFLPADLGGFYGQVMFAMNEQTNYDPGSATPPGSAALNANPALALVPDNARAGRYWGARGGYANGALDVALAYGVSTLGSNYYLGTTTELDIWNLGASYDFGFAKVFGEFSNNKLNVEHSNPALSFPHPGAAGFLLGASVPVGPGLIRLAYSNVRYKDVVRPVALADVEPESEKFSLGYVHNLSKRTALYVSVARLNNKNGADLLLGGPTYLPGGAATGPFTPKSSTGYDIGMRTAF